MTDTVAQEEAYLRGYDAGRNDQISDEFRYSVVATVGKNNPEARVGSYRSNFEALAVSDAWNAINNKHGVTYRVEVDW